MKKIGIVGHNTELGRLLVGLPNFHSVDDEIINGISLRGKYDVLVDCDFYLDVPSFDNKYDEAITKIRKLAKLHDLFDTKILALASNGKGHPNTILASATKALSSVHGGKVAFIPVCKDQRDLQYVVLQLENILLLFDSVSPISFCKLPNFFTKLFGK